ncbi:hypothetical protein [Xanthomonas sp. 3058]|uniref:hypothetical protein n=1 Tax=Xanthomonas sp. 3058 TaxID=3035314 RepID=UPI00161244EA|nr:hypothetical protein [Xanthomonas sp. 3058]MBB5862423.1 hypothetical protein [Xanthomonas sp. 3058]
MALHATYLAFSDKPDEFSAFIGAHARPVAPGVFIVEGKNARQIVKTLAEAAGIAVYVVEVNLADIERLA